MALNRQSGNLYGWVTHSWNPIGGQCPHRCSYCWVNSLKRFPKIKEKYSGEPRLIAPELETALGKGNFIFVGSSIDMFADAIPTSWIRRVLTHCNKFPGNKYLFQTKNPWRFHNFSFPSNTILATTIESNRHFQHTFFAPSPYDRMTAMIALKGRKMLTIEPVMDFDLNPFVSWVKAIAPEFVTIGADSKGHHLPEPKPYTIKVLIAELERFTVVKQKSNLQRLLS